jgi:hypothetical protein
VAVGVVISDPMESVVALHYLPWDFLFLGVRGVALRRGFKLTHYRKSEAGMLKHRAINARGIWTGDRLCFRFKIEGDGGGE